VSQMAKGMNFEKRFGDIDEEFSNFEKSKVCIIQAPYEGTVTYMKGTARGPKAIIDASTNMELFDDELQTEVCTIGISTGPPLELDTLKVPDDVVDRVRHAVADLLEDQKFPVILGGEHTVSVGAVEAAKEQFNNLSVLLLDAHYDLRDVYMNSKYNHACVARRIQEVCPLVEVGARSISGEAKQFLDKGAPRVKIVNMNHVLRSANWKQDVSRLLSNNVYISIDLDVLDPSIMPSVGTPEPGGMGWHDILDLLKVVTWGRTIVGLDIVELSPRDGFIGPDYLAAKLLYRLLGYIFIESKKK
jgi:agmatinase